MERFGILEMEAVAEVHREEARTGWKYEAFHTVLDNDFHNVPEGWTLVFLRSTPVQVVPDLLLASIEMESVQGFAHDPEQQCLVCFYDANSEAGISVYRAIMRLVVNWLDANL